MAHADTEAPTALSRILVVDDNAAMCEAISLVLEEEDGLHVCGKAHRIQEAVAMASSQQPDLAMIDLSLRGEDGLELIDHVRRVASAAKILVFSLHDDERNIERVRVAGADGYASKRRGPDELVRALRGVLSGRHPFHAPDSA